MIISQNGDRGVRKTYSDRFALTFTLTGYYMRQRLPDRMAEECSNGTLTVAIRGFYAPEQKAAPGAE